MYPFTQALLEDHWLEGKTPTDIGKEL